MNTEDLLNELEDQIRSGQDKKARTTLDNLSLKDVDRKYLQPLANIARRLRMPNTALKILNPIVRDPREQNTPSIEERAEYAATLVQVGATEESLSILEELQGEHFPDVWLNLSHAYFSLWKYEKAIPYIEQYVKHATTDYQILVGQINLSAAYLVCRKYEPFMATLNSVQRNARKHKHWLLYGNSLELMAQYYILLGDYESALKAVDDARWILKDSEGIYKFFTIKWRVITQLLKDPADGQINDFFLKAKAEATERGHWESMREFDLYESIAKGNEPQFHQVYFGTPFRDYRLRMFKLLRQQIPLPSVYYYGQSIGLELGPCFDLAKGVDEVSEAFLNTGKLLHKLVVLLSSDFYRPQRVGTIFHLLFPEEYYNPETSPQRVYQAVRRLRNWFMDNKIPLSVAEFDGAYRIQVDSPNYHIRLLNPDMEMKKKSAHIIQLQTHYGYNEFSAKQAAQFLEISVSKVTRILNTAMEHGDVVKLGSGPRTRYRLNQEAA